MKAALKGPKVRNLPAKRPMLQFQCLSDIHIEYRKGNTCAKNRFEIPQRRTPYLALLGDISDSYNEGYESLRDFLRECCAVFDQVWFVCGNHEGYGASHDAAMRVLREFEASVGRARFALLDKSFVDVPGTTVRVLGCTLWTYIPTAEREKATRVLREFSQMSDMTLERYHALHEDHVAWLHAACNEATRLEKHIVILTHHAPTVTEAYPRNDLLARAHEVVMGAGGTPLVMSPPSPSDSDAALSDDTDDGSAEFHHRCNRFNSKRYPRLVMHAFGHTHWNVDTMQHGIRLVTNQVCYPSPADPYVANPCFIPHDPDKVLTILEDGTTEPESEESINARRAAFQHQLEVAALPSTKLGTTPWSVDSTAASSPEERATFPSARSLDGLDAADDGAQGGAVVAAAAPTAVHHHSSGRCENDAGCGRLPLSVRMKSFEEDSVVDPRNAFLVRLDGKSFSTFTAPFRKPFDMRLTRAMISTCVELARFFSEASAAFVCSDEITLVFPPIHGHMTEHAHGGRKTKIATLAAGKCSVFFLQAISSETAHDAQLLAHVNNDLPCFDARVVEIPCPSNATDVAKNLYWRSVIDCRRNTISAYGRYYMGTGGTAGKRSAEVVEALKDPGQILYKEALAHLGNIAGEVAAAEAAEATGERGGDPAEVDALPHEGSGLSGDARSASAAAGVAQQSPAGEGEARGGGARTSRGQAGGHRHQRNQLQKQRAARIAEEGAIHKDDAACVISGPAFDFDRLPLYRVYGTFLKRVSFTLHTAQGTSYTRTHPQLFELKMDTSQFEELTAWLLAPKVDEIAVSEHQRVLGAVPISLVTADDSDDEDGHAKAAAVAATAATQPTH